MLYIFLLLFSLSAQADWRSISASDFSLPPPPMVGSPEDIQDLEGVLRAQAERGRRDCDFGKEHFEFNFESLYSGVLRPGEIQKAAPLIDDLFEITGRIHGEFKSRYRRNRPFVADSRVKPCLNRPGNYS